MNDNEADERDTLRRDIAMKIVGLSDRGEVTLTAVERLLVEYGVTLNQKNT
jgi:hypothetical protein